MKLNFRFESKYNLESEMDKDIGESQLVVKQVNDVYNTIYSKLQP